MIYADLILESIQAQSDHYKYFVESYIFAETGECSEALPSLH